MSQTTGTGLCNISLGVGRCQIKRMFLSCKLHLLSQFCILCVKFLGNLTQLYFVGNFIEILV